MNPTLVRNDRYEVLEKAIADTIANKFSDILSPEVVVQSDIDRLFERMQNTDSTYGCLVEFCEAQKLTNSPFNGQMWQWTLFGNFLIRYRGSNEDIQSQTKKFLNRIRFTFENNKTLGGLVAKVDVVKIETPAASTINEVPFMWIMFVIEALEPI